MSEKIVITGDQVVKSSLPFSAAIRSGNLLFISGQGSTDLNGNIINDSFEAECRRSFDNLGEILKAAGLGFEHVIQVRNYVGSQENLAAFNNIYREYFKPPYPVRTTIMNCLGTVLKFETEAIAQFPSK